MVAENLAVLVLVEHFCEQSQHAVNHARLIGGFNLIPQRELICVCDANGCVPENVRIRLTVASSVFERQSLAGPVGVRV